MSFEKIINQNDETHSKAKLDQYYKNNLIPPEKKAYLTQLKDSIGPYMACESSENQTSYLMDAASQIATLGLGFNPLPFFGVLHHLESWTNDTESEHAKKIFKNYKDFLARKLGMPSEKIGLSIRNSGAEANETALGYCYEKRVFKSAKKVLAFEGSFHGRMQMSLMATWNPSKRQPFEWPGYEACYAPFPEIKSDNVNYSFPEGWLNFWDRSTSSVVVAPEEWTKDPIIHAETQSLLKVREHLLSKNIFAIIVETMQCEGGDRYGTNRFFSALLVMARSFKIQVIFDEVQTGFHLGREFFWTKHLNLKDASGKSILPNYIVGAKKAQVGLVISCQDETRNDTSLETSMASMVRGLIHGMVIDQMSSRILDLELLTKKYLIPFCQKYSEYVEHPRGQGMAFAFDLKDKAHLNTYVEKRFARGLLYYPAGDNTLRFRLNTAFKENDMAYLFKCLAEITEEIYQKKPHPLPSDATCTQAQKKQIHEAYDWHEFLVNLQFDQLNSQSNFSPKLYWEKAKKMAIPSGYNLVEIGKSNFAKYSKAIVDLQKETYEPVRQTPITLFETAVKEDKGFGLILEKEGKLVAISFGAPMAYFPLERGLRRDPQFNNQDCFYMLDTTVKNGHQGDGLGKIMKSLALVYAHTKGAEYINGRNRDRLAGAMLSINLSLGALESDYQAEDYLDNSSHRDVIFYSTKLKWENTLNMTNAIQSPLDSSEIDGEFVKNMAPILVNKICLSNFVDSQFLENLQTVFNQLPESLRHGYSTSGQSECVDKIAKSIWLSGHQQNRLLTFKGCYFGKGSFLSRGISNLTSGPFETTTLPYPDSENEQEILDQVRNEISKSPHMAIWIEPVRQLDFKHVSKNFLLELLNLGKQHKTPVVFNETASAFYRFSDESFFASNDNLMPDAVMIYLGGQAGLCALKPQFYIDKPLMLISTWDGDEYSTAVFAKALSLAVSRKKEIHELRKVFMNVLRSELEGLGVTKIELHQGRGSFKGPVPYTLGKYFKNIGNKYLVCPNQDAMNRFIDLLRD